MYLPLHPTDNKMKLYLCLVLMLFGAAAGQLCIQVPGWLKQIDAGAGQVYGVNDYNGIYRLIANNNWVAVPGSLIHVSVGPFGLWGANSGYSIYKMQDGNWVNVAGALKQVDAGGIGQLVGVNQFNNIYCLNQDAILSKSGNLIFNLVEGSLKYYSCGLYGCWGVNSNNDIFKRLKVSPRNCKGSEWKQVKGKLVMVEVGTDGSVYGLNKEGQIFRRQGISASNPIGTVWTRINIVGTFKHLSFDEGILWLINTDGNIFRCGMH
uniref:Fish-egg lectin n=1 Tax=Leptobrachium leishanense TaxID=445787 RepID=A0A8C5R891_9ANUR